MPTATIQIDAGGAGTMTEQKTITANHLTRFIAAIRIAYNIPPETTDIEALRIWADFVFDQAKRTTLGIEQSSAASGVSNIDFS